MLGGLNRRLERVSICPPLSQTSHYPQSLGPFGDLPLKKSRLYQKLLQCVVGGLLKQTQTRKYPSQARLLLEMLRTIHGPLSTQLHQLPMQPRQMTHQLDSQRWMNSRYCTILGVILPLIQSRHRRSNPRKISVNVWPMLLRMMPLPWRRHNLSPPQATNRLMQRRKLTRMMHRNLYPLPILPLSKRPISDHRWSLPVP